MTKLLEETFAATSYPEQTYFISNVEWDDFGASSRARVVWRAKLASGEASTGTVTQVYTDEDSHRMIGTICKRQMDHFADAEK